MRKETSTNWLNERKIKASCGMAYTLSLIGGRWKPAILWKLLTNRYRYSELRKSLPDVSERILITQLRELERDGLVKRTLHTEVPTLTRVEYELTELGRSTEAVLHLLSDWGDTHRNKPSAEHNPG